MSSSFEDDHHEAIMRDRAERFQRQVNAIRDRVERMHESMNAGLIQESEVNRRFKGKMVSEVLRDMVSRYFEQDGNEIDEQ